MLLERTLTCCVMLADGPSCQGGLPSVNKLHGRLLRAPPGPASHLNTGCSLWSHSIDEVPREWDEPQEADQGVPWQCSTWRQSQPELLSGLPHFPEHWPSFDSPSLCWWHSLKYRESPPYSNPQPMAKGSWRINTPVPYPLGWVALRCVLYTGPQGAHQDLPLVTHSCHSVAAVVA